MTRTRRKFGVRVRKAVIHNDTVCLAGMIATEPFLPMKAQMAEVLAQICERLERAGSSREKRIMVGNSGADMRRAGS